MKISNIMRTSIVTIATAAAIAAVAAFLSSDTVRRYEASLASWDAYCIAYDVIDPENPTDQELTDYVDCWQGSADEEAALTPAQLKAIYK